MVALNLLNFIRLTLYKVLKLNEYLDYQSKEFLDLISMNVVKIRKSKGFSQLRLAVEMGYSVLHILEEWRLEKTVNISI